MRLIDLLCYVYGLRETGAPLANGYSDKTDIKYATDRTKQAEAIKMAAILTETSVFEVLKVNIDALQVKPRAGSGKLNT